MSLKFNIVRTAAVSKVHELLPLKNWFQLVENLYLVSCISKVPKLISDWISKDVITGICK